MNCFRAPSRFRIKQIKREHCGSLYGSISRSANTPTCHWSAPSTGKVGTHKSLLLFLYFSNCSRLHSCCYLFFGTNTNAVDLVRFYEGVLELCLTAADKKDPQRLGPHYYKNGEPEDDRVGQQAFQERYHNRQIAHE